MSKVPRPYQFDAVNATYEWFRQNPTGNPLVALPTGTGKSFVIAGQIWTMRNQVDPTHRFLMVTHSAKLVQQNADTLLDLWPNAPLGIHAEKLGKRDTLQPIIFGTRDSVWATIKKKGNVFGIRNSLLIDEAHCVPPRQESSYRRIIESLEADNPNMRGIGYTATAFRMGLGTLIEEGSYFTDFAYNKTELDDFNQFIRDGYLVPLFPKNTETEIDLSDVKIVAGEFNQKELEAASNQERITIAAIREALTLAHDRNHWLVYCAGISHVESVVHILEWHGIPCDYVHSKRTDAENERAIARAQSGGIRALVNADMLTTGFDWPEVDAILMLRATNSPGLHVQMLGRGTRPAPWVQKRNCLILDYARNVARLGPINDPLKPRKPGERKGNPAPVKQCQNPDCRVLNHCSARECIACLWPFELNVKIKQTAGEHEVIAGYEQAPTKQEVWKVDHVFYTDMRSSANGLPMLRVQYSCGTKMASELVLIEHPGFPGIRARQWWKERTQGADPPSTVYQALILQSQLKPPKSITVRIESGEKYPKILSAAL